MSKQGVRINKQRYLRNEKPNGASFNTPHELRNKLLASMGMTPDETSAWKKNENDPIRKCCIARLSFCIVFSK